MGPLAMSTRSLHLWIGFGGVLVFLGTGVYMRLAFPELYGGNESVRYMYRANHVYVLLGSLINLVVGVYFMDFRSGWRRTVALGGSWLLLGAPFVLLLAFFFEAPRGIPERIITGAGVFMLFLGVLAQWPNRALHSGERGR